MARSIIDTLTPIAVYGGLGYLLIRRGADGKSILDGITQGLGHGIATGILPATSPSPTPSGSQPFPTASPGGGDNQWGSDNGKLDTFNVNLAESWWYLDAVNLPGAPVTIKGHVGVGHMGSGGSFACVLWGQNLGVLGIGQGSPTWLWQQNFAAGHDSDFAGYGIDFSGVDLGQAAGNLGKTNVWASIVGINGENYTQANLTDRLGG